jgi:hypothetical protein
LRVIARIRMAALTRSVAAAFMNTLKFRILFREFCMAIKQVKNVADIPSHDMDDWGLVELLIFEQISQLRLSGFYFI